MSGALRLEGVSVRPAAGGAPLFAPLDLVVAPGTVLTLMGPSGIGKSTLIDWIGGHLGADFIGAGRIVLDGRDVTALPAEARRIGILFLDAALFPHLSVGDNLAFGLRAGLRGRAARAQAVAEALRAAGLEGFARRDPATLSGGQRTRVALMRTLLAAPLALLLDEPFARLDPATRSAMRGFVFGHMAARQVPAILVTHDAEDARAAGGPVVTLRPAPPPPPPQPAITYAQVADAIQKAQTLDALHTAADLIGEVYDERQREELTAAYKVRESEI
jgi:putative thiamine transport system ATP-binding protein